jgi:ammonium transporter Rh
MKMMSADGKDATMGCGKGVCKAVGNPTTCCTLPQSLADSMKDYRGAKVICQATTFTEVAKESDFASCPTQCTVSGGTRRLSSKIQPGGATSFNNPDSDVSSNFDPASASDADRRLASKTQPQGATSVYNHYVGVALMMLVGFGYLMTFLRGYSLSAVGFTLYITCLGVQLAMVAESFMEQETTSIKLSVYSVLDGNFAAAALLISFAAVIRKASSLQLTVIVFCEALIYCANKVFLLNKWLEIRDCGGAITVHIFGAYFGILCSAVMGAPKVEGDTSYVSDGYVSDILSFIGTVFLWLFWPSFVGGALKPGTAQDRALLNTILALLSSTVACFFVAPILSNRKISTAAIQRATLAGGVTIAATADLALTPFGAAMIGTVAGMVSCYFFVHPLIPSHWQWDPCGINSLHGIPGILGGLSSALVPVWVKDTGVVERHQLMGLVGTLVVSSLGGAATGFICKYIFDVQEGSTFWFNPTVAPALRNKADFKG